MLLISGQTCSEVPRLRCTSDMCRSSNCQVIWKKDRSHHFYFFVYLYLYANIYLETRAFVCGGFQWKHLIWKSVQYQKTEKCSLLFWGSPLCLMFFKGYFHTALEKCAYGESWGCVVSFLSGCFMIEHFHVKLFSLPYNQLKYFCFQRIVKVSHFQGLVSLWEEYV